MHLLLPLRLLLQAVVVAAAGGGGAAAAVAAAAAAAAGSFKTRFNSNAPRAEERDGAGDAQEGCAAAAD